MKVFKPVKDLRLSFSFQMAMPRQPEDAYFKIAQLPIMEGPFTRISDHMWTYQSSLCRDWEMDYMRCAGRVGLQQSEKKCSKLLDDWEECLFRRKQVILNVIIMTSTVDGTFRWTNLDITALSLCAFAVNMHKRGRALMSKLVGPDMGTRTAQCPRGRG